MKVKERKAKKKRLFPLYAKIRKINLKEKFLSHSYFYRVAGESLPSRHSNRTRAKVLWSFAATIVLFFMVVYAINLVTQVLDITSSFVSSLNNPDIEVKQYDFSQWDYSTLKAPLQVVTIVSSGILGAIAGFKIDFALHPLADGQKGDSRLSTLKETRNLCKEVPDREKRFEGIGGVPFSHFKNKLMIDTDTVNTCFVGTSRSGKGQTTVFSLIDNLSRAEEQSSMIINDPKTELYTASKEPLEKLGYEVLAYNVLDPLQSMSDNSLALIVKYWKRGDIDTATELTNTLTNTIYNDPNAGDNKYFNENAQKAVNAIIFTLLEHAEKHNNYDKVTPNNIVELLTELGSLNYKLDEEDFHEKNALDEFMNRLPAGNVAKKQYGATKMGSDKARGNILSTALMGLNPFTLPKVAKMTSLSSLDYKSIGFPKYLDIKLEEEMASQRIVVTFLRKGKKIHKEKMKVESKGFAELNFNCDLENGDEIQLSYSKKGKKQQTTFTFNRKILLNEKGEVVYRKKTGEEHLPEYDKFAELKEIETLENKLVVEKITCHYSDKPIAIFMLTPDFNSSNHVLISIFIKQVYTELSTQCVRTRGDKCHRRIHWILDEFGNMPAIADMENVMTVTAGRNMLFDLFVQSYAQIFSKYGEDTGKIIKENCQTHIYIMSTDDDTIEEFSKKVGHRTVVQEQADTGIFGNNKSISRSVDQERVLPYERIQDFLEGETLVLPKLKRRNKYGRKVRAFPIFNTGKTVMPYAYQYLDDYNNGGDIQDIDIESKHMNINLEDFQLDYMDFFVDEQAKAEYLKQKVA